jgi:hypothetical protein
MKKINVIRQGEERFFAQERRRRAKLARRQAESRSTGAALQWLARQKEQSHDRPRTGSSEES